MRSLKRLSMLLVLAVPAAGAHAISFSNFLINGSAPGAGNPSAFGPSGVSFSIPQHFLVGIGVQSLTIQYRVTATPGNVLTGYSYFPVGNAKNGKVEINTDHTNGGTQNTLYSFTAGGTLQSLPSVTNVALSPQQSFFDVTTVITLTGQTTDALNKVTIYSVSYTEAVPEPATMAALGLGFGTILARRNRRKK